MLVRGPSGGGKEVGGIRAVRLDEQDVCPRRQGMDHSTSSAVLYSPATGSIGAWQHEPPVWFTMVRLAVGRP